MNAQTGTFNESNSAPAASVGDRIRHSKALIPTMAVMVVAVAALAASLAVSHSHANDAGQAGVATSAPPVTQAAVKPQANLVAPAAVHPIHKPHAVALVQHPQTAVVASTQICVDCGTVESVATVQRQGEVNGIGNSGIGLGAVGGAVLGGVLGNQVGNGNGKTIATVLGAIGGGYAGNAVQKNMNKVTVYQVRVRMQDGSYRTVEQSGPVAAGTPVVVSGGALRVVGGTS